MPNLQLRNLRICNCLGWKGEKASPPKISLAVSNLSLINHVQIFDRPHTSGKSRLPHSRRAGQVEGCHQGGDQQMDSSKESTSFINQGVFAILPEEQLFSHIVSHPIVRNMKWSFLAFIPKQTRRRRWTPCLIFLLEAPEWLAAGLNTGSSDNKNMESRQVNTRSK